ncbi:MAG TPA: hypothetical protein VHL53_19725 [Acidimicrobiia bacterium]|nr:hypothetical protein [Acidimicrobiia bacterium]
MTPVLASCERRLEALPGQVRRGGVEGRRLPEPVEEGLTVVGEPDLAGRPGRPEGGQDVAPGLPAPLRCAAPGAGRAGRPAPRG